MGDTNATQLRNDMHAQMTEVSSRESDGSALFKTNLLFLDECTKIFQTNMCRITVGSSTN